MAHYADLAPRSLATHYLESFGPPDWRKEVFMELYAIITQITRTDKTAHHQSTPKGVPDKTNHYKSTTNNIPDRTTHQYT